MQKTLNTDLNVQQKYGQTQTHFKNLVRPVLPILFRKETWNTKKCQSMCQTVSQRFQLFPKQSVIQSQFLQQKRCFLFTLITQGTCLTRHFQCVQSSSVWQRPCLIQGKQTGTLVLSKTVLRIFYTTRVTYKNFSLITIITSERALAKLLFVSSRVFNPVYEKYD